MKPARWLVLRVTAPPLDDAAALVTEALIELGGRAVWQEGEVLVTHLLPSGSEAEFLRETRTRLEALLAPATHPIETSWQEHEDWAETWKRGLTARRVSPRLIVTPSWIEPAAEEGALALVLDPGMAFGNAEHGTTRGCLRLLDGVVEEGARVLDVGAGSGILSIAAALLGAADVVAIEGDPLAWDTLEENVERNGVTGRVQLVRAWADAASLGALDPFDGVLANLEAGILAPLLTGLAGAVARDGWLVLSGLLEDDLPPLTSDAEALGLRWIATDADGEWRSLLYQRAGDPEAAAQARAAPPR